MEGIPLIGYFEGEKRPVFVDEAEEDLIAFPHGKFEQALFFDPFEVALVAFDLVARPVSADEEMHVFAFPDVGDEGDNAAVAPLRDGIARFFPHLAQHAVLGALPFFELAAHPEPFVVVEVVFFLGAVQHEVLAAALKVTLGGLFHCSSIFESGPSTLRLASGTAGVGTLGIIKKQGGQIDRLAKTF